MSQNAIIKRAPKVMPPNIREAIQIAANICRRIAAKRLAMLEKDALIKHVPTSYGGSNEVR